MDLDAMMHGPSALPVMVKPDGTFEQTTYPPALLAEHAPESIDLPWSGSWEMPDVFDTHERDAMDSVEGGWEVLSGWGDDGSLFIFRNDRRHFGPVLEERILEEPGLWAIVSVEMHAPACTDGNPHGMPCEEWNERERCAHLEEQYGEYYPTESKAAGWALVRRDRAVTMGESIVSGGREFVPVLRDGRETGTHIDETSRGHIFRVPGSMTEDGFGYAGEPRVSLDDARKDAEQWLTEHVA